MTAKEGASWRYEGAVQFVFGGPGHAPAARSDEQGNQEAYGYDAAGNLVTQTDARGTALWFGYDALNRLTEKRLSNSGGQLLAQYYYDEAGYGASTGRRTRSVAYVNGVVTTTTTSYDSRGRVTSTMLNLDGVIVRA